MELAQLLAGIDISNNGYIFIPTKTELDLAAANPDVVKVRNGKIYRTGTKIDMVPMPPMPPRQYVDEFDYEGAILARQSIYQD
jgi:hypothetical protein